MITIDHNKFDIKKVNFSGQNLTKLGNKWYFGYGNDNCSYEIMTPEMNLPFGLDTDAEGKKYIRGEFPDYLHDKSCKNFINILRFHEELTKLNLKNRMGDKPFFTFIKFPEDPKYAPSLKIKLNFRFRRYEVDFYDRNGDRTTSSAIKKGTNARVKLLPKEVWENDQYYGILWTASVIKITD